jgi:hypothetical protein
MIAVSDRAAMFVAGEGLPTEARHRTREESSMRMVLRATTFRYLLIELDFGTGEEATKFLDFLTTRVWSTPANAPALKGTPQTRILDLVEQS